MCVRVRYAGDRLRAEVLDDGDWQAVPRRDSDRDGGWGLRIVEQLTDGWGVFEGSTHVFELSIEGLETQTAIAELAPRNGGAPLDGRPGPSPTPAPPRRTGGSRDGRERQRPGEPTPTPDALYLEDVGVSERARLEMSSAEETGLATGGHRGREQRAVRRLAPVARGATSSESGGREARRP